jgi:arsenite-transporting ATPase
VGSLLCGESLVKWRECSGVTVFEADEEDVKRLWVERFGEEVYEVISSIAPVGREVIDYLAGAPGIADQYMLYLVYTIAEGREYELVVWDTAAAGGSLRLLRVEYELYSHLGDAARMYMKLRGFLESLRRRDRGGGRDPLSLIEEWRGLARGILDFMSSSRHRLAIVAVGDHLSAAVTRMLVREFSSHGIQPRVIVLNMYVRPGICSGCPLVEEDARLQEEAIAEIESLGIPVYRVERMVSRPRSVGDLRVLAGRLEGLVDILAG